MSVHHHGAGIELERANNFSPDHRQVLAQGGRETVLKPFVMPVSHTADDFGLSDRDHNRQQAQRLLAGSHKVLHADDRVVLGISTQAALIEIFIYKKSEAALTYHLRCEIAELDQLGIAATQVAVWRRAAPGLIGGTSGIVHMLLDGFDAVVSAPSVTPAGQRFWIDRMAEAEDNGMTVGLAREDKLELFPKGEWLKQAAAWGEGEEFKDLRYFISKKPLGDQ
ncbi:hypothetical protein [Mesorhizobium sp. KR2-14]|uniref:hypothetical protein n=1 Tax=Mesorhizobium sp. KR2-14 TaxID=3156610 RepID=UPI0032B5F787